MPAGFDHEKLRVYREAVRFVGWIEPLLETVPMKVSARDQLDRASTSIVLNLAEGNGKRSRADRCRFLDIARGSALECAACLDVLVARKRIDPDSADVGKETLVGIVSMIAGLIDHFAPTAEQEPAVYSVGHALPVENEND